MKENKPSLPKRLIHSWNERRGMTAMANVLSGRKPKWYARPFSWVTPLILFGVIAFTFSWELFRYLVIPLLVVCMFFTLHRMNNQLDRIEAALNKPADTAIVVELIQEKNKETD